MQTPIVRLRPGLWTEYDSHSAQIRSYVRGNPQNDGVPIDFRALEALPSASEVAEWTGQFAVMVVAGGTALLITDHSRSIPILYSPSGAAFGDDHDAILQGVITRDPVAAMEFAHAGMVTGARTLFAGLRQVRAGEIVTIEFPQFRATGELYRRFTYSRKPVVDTAAVNELFDSALGAGFERLIERANGRQLAVPLSGGLDSRLISAYLKTVGYDNVVNFTYGRPGTSEVSVSENVASALGQQWHFVPYPPRDVAVAWASAEAGRYIEFAHSASALPHVQDWYALHQLREHKLLDDDAIILPGHTMVGNIHNPELLDEPGRVSERRIKDVLIDYHYPLLGRSGQLSTNITINREIDAYLAALGYDGSVLSRADAIEYFNISERQAKYINNSMRAYEFFGYDWALPMLDTEMYRMWESLDLRFTRDRSWYRGYVNEWFERASGVNLGYFAPMSTSDSTRNAVKSALGRVGLEPAAQRALTTLAVLRHHMSFNRLVGELSQAEVGRRTLRGQNILGIYAELFLRDTWNPHTHVFG